MEIKIATINLVDKEFPKIDGAELFLAGGCVRDKLLGVPIKDRDFVVVTKLSFEELEEEIRKIGTVFISKKEFLTIRCRIENEAIDIAFPRGESGYRDGRHPDNVMKVGTLKEDASRRDFTLNSIFMDSKGEIFDYFGGQDAIENKEIKAVGDPYERFSEDFLRIIRGIRFSVKYNFHIEDNTFKAMKKEAHNLNKISFERVKDELNMALKHNPWDTISYIKELGIESILENMGLKLQLTSAII